MPRSTGGEHPEVGEKEEFVGDAKFWFETYTKLLTYHQDIQFGRMAARLIVTLGEPKAFARATHVEPIADNVRHLLYNPDGTLKTEDKDEQRKVLKEDFIRVNIRALGVEGAEKEFQRLYKKYCDPNEKVNTRCFNFFPLVQNAPSNWRDYYFESTSEVTLWANKFIASLQKQEGPQGLKDKEVLGYEIKLKDGQPENCTLEVSEDVEIDILSYVRSKLGSGSEFNHPTAGDRTKEELKIAWDLWARKVALQAEAEPTKAGIGANYVRYFYHDPEPTNENSKFKLTPSKLLSYDYALDKDGNIKSFTLTVRRAKKQDFTLLAQDYFKKSGEEVFSDLAATKDPNLTVQVVLEYLPKDKYWPQWIKDQHRHDVSDTPYEEYFVDRQRRALGLVLKQIQEKGDLFQALQRLESARILAEALVYQGAPVLASKNQKLTEAFNGFNNIPSATDILYSLSFGLETRETYPELRRRLRLRVESALSNLKEGADSLQKQIKDDKGKIFLGHSEVVRARKAIEKRLEELK